ncbi:MAG: UDP-N-acetylmuramoyl-L-alanine--D-glutamate ligase [Alphaproteobacteria bacterium]
MGLGKTGLATARALARSGAVAWVWDDTPARRAGVEAEGIRVVDLSACDWSGSGVAALVWSPGIAHIHPKPHPIATAARAAGIAPVCDVELLIRARPEAGFVGITGTNGKSTTTALIAHILERCGRRVAVGGNLGTPVLEFPPLGADGTYVVELSSYQLELTPSLAARVAVLLNITPDHLGRHGGMDGYVAAKRRIFASQPKGATAVIGVDDDLCRTIHRDLVAAGDDGDGRTVVAISAAAPVAGGVWADRGVLVDDLSRRSRNQKDSYYRPQDSSRAAESPEGGNTGGRAETILDLATARALPGRHNWQNAAAAYAATRALGLPPAAIATAIQSFPGLPHRQELVAEVAGVRYVNDSKATNADAAEKAMSCYDAIYWIAGGQAKEGGIVPLAPLFPRVRHAFLIGEAAPAFGQTLEGRVPVTQCGTLAVAVEKAAALATREGIAGAVVLLSPACASWDQFSSFEERGARFRDMVTSLTSGREARP